MRKVKTISLGCAKNRVDSEVILGHLVKNGFTTSNDTKDADLIMVNTCGFINEAKEESINTILEIAEEKQKDAKLIVVGCLSQRYHDDLVKTMPEVDEFIKISDYPKLNEIIGNLYDHDIKLKGAMTFENKLVSTPSYMQYIKISEGCLNRCAFCAIPLIRGNLESRTIEEIKEEVRIAISNNIYEINIISQDSTRYGFDIYKKNSLVELLKELVKLEGNYKIRLFYLYPEHITEELLDFIRENHDKIYHYFDIPMQHASDKILKLMKRRGDRLYLTNLINKIREKIPLSVIRTTMIVGFPYETEEDFEILKSFIKEMKFDHLGVFKYSNEEGTLAYTYEKEYHVAKSVKSKRYKEIYRLQEEIAKENKRKLLNQELECFITSYPVDDYFYRARSEYFGPEEIDGEILVALKQEHKIGDVIKVKVLDYDAYSITAEEIEC